MKLRIRVDGGIGQVVERALTTLNVEHQATAGDFIVSLDLEDLPFESGAITLVVTSDPARRGRASFPDAAAVVHFSGDFEELVARMDSVLHFAKAACIASPYRKLMEECPVPIFVKSTAGCILYANAASRAEPERAPSLSRPVACG